MLLLIHSVAILTVSVSLLICVININKRIDTTNKEIKKLECDCFDIGYSSKLNRIDNNQDELARILKTHSDQFAALEDYLKIEPKLNHPPKLKLRYDKIKKKEEKDNG